MTTAAGTDGLIATGTDAPPTASVRPTPSATGTAKLTVALPAEAIQAIERIAARDQKTKTQVLREAIALKAFIEDELREPGTRLLIERGGTTREIVFK